MSAAKEDGSLGKRAPLSQSAHTKEEDGNEHLEDQDQQVNWTYLEHHGVLFPAEYEPAGLSINFEGQSVPLSPIQEELAFYWSQGIGSEWETKPEYRLNFSHIFASALGDKKYLALDKFDFSPIVQLIAKRKEDKKLRDLERKNLSQSEKNKEKQEKEIRDATHGYAILDWTREKLGGYMIEPPTLFKGRGSHPKSGYFKPRTYPEDITINVSSDAPVPKCTVPGRAWRDIVHKKDVTWLAFYRDEAINNTFKYFFLSANSRIKSQNDMKKYEKARKLKSEVDRIRKDYMEKAKGKDKYYRELGTVAYFIDKLALRVGNEKNEEEEADTVGCCSLRKEHIQLMPDMQVKFDFLGKDSMRYENTVTVDQNIYKNLETFLVGKKAEDDLFSQINPARLNEYFSSLMDGLTAKVFRTFNASFTLDQELNHEVPSTAVTVEDKCNFYNEANMKVALLCNHQKTVNKDFDARIDKSRKKVDELKGYLVSLEEHLRLIKAGKKGLVSEEEPNPDSLCKLKKKYPISVEATKDSISKLKKRISDEDGKIEERVKTKNVSLGTSKINYNDPRISVSWCKRNDVPIERIFSSELRGKFTWAMSIEPTWRF